MDSEHIRLLEWLSEQHKRGLCYVEPAGMDWPMFFLYRDGRVLIGELRSGAPPDGTEWIEMYRELERSGNEVQIWRSADIAERACKGWLWEHWRLWQEDACSDYPDKCPPRHD